MSKNCGFNLGFIGVLNSIPKITCSYNNINKDKIFIRNIKNGIQLHDVFYYRFLYSFKNTTKDFITSKINKTNKTTYNRQSYDSKDKNIPIECYRSLFEQIIGLYNSHFKVNKLDEIVIAVDGTNTNNNEHDVILNMGYYNVTHDLPIDLTFNGAENRNKEVRCFKKYITENMEDFKNGIIVADRFYFTYDLLSFLNDNNLKYIIRIKGNGFNLDKINPKKSDPNYQFIMKLRKEDRILRYNNQITKTANHPSKKKFKKHDSITFENDCVIITNLSDKYSKEDIMNKYRSRWSIETFFNFIKRNFKCQHQLENFKSDSYQKMYYCELFVSVLCEIIIKTYMDKYNKQIKEGYTIKVNKSNIVSGIYDFLIYDIIKGQLTEEMMETFMETYIKIIKNKKERSFPRISKTPFSKWYLKSYSCNAKLLEIIRAYKEGKINELDKNKKMLFNKITAINGIQIK